MNRRALNLEQFVAHLARAVKRAGTQRALAHEMGVSEAYISDVLRGRRLPSRRLLTAMGISRRWTFHVTGQE